MSEQSNIHDVPFQDELGASFGRYAQKVILDRAIPDIRDGLKPVQRRIIFAMHDSKNTHDRPYRKSAKTVGDVMGNYHPHGDSSIYDALVRLAQPWKMRYPLIDGHGNFGSLDDDPAAAMRYTEARLSEIASVLLLDIEKDTVPWRPNFDEKIMEPVVLPAGFLNLLVNGTSGVSAGFATDIPSHNLGEIIDGVLAVMKQPEIELDGLMRHIKGPDFPTGGILSGLDGLKDAYENGRGRVVLRARHEVELTNKKNKLLVFTEIPYQVVKSDLVREIDDMRLGKEVIGIQDVRDESDRHGLRLVVELQKGADEEVVLAYLFKKTALEINYHFNMVSIANNTPVLLGLRAMLDAFIQHRQRIVRRRSQYDYDRKSSRLHNLEGLIRAVDILDEVIAAIRKSQNRAEAQDRLVAEFAFTHAQADAILELKLHRLTNLEILVLEEEAAQLTKELELLGAILADPKMLDQVVMDELKDIKRRFGDERRTSIEEQLERLEVDLVKATVKEADVVVGVTRLGWIKQTTVASFVASGATRKTSGVRPGDRMLRLIHTRTTHTVLAFSDRGQCYPIPVYSIPEAKWGDMGTSLINVCGISPEERLVDLIPVEDFDEERYFLFLTEQGRAKLTPVAEFDSSRATGLMAFKVPEDDALARVIESDGKGDLLIVTHLGQGIRFTLPEVSVQGRAASGVKALNVGKHDWIVDALPISKEDLEDESLKVAVFTSSGRAKASPLDQFPLQRRGGKGVRMVMALIRRQQECVALSAMRENDSFELVDSEGNEHLVDASSIRHGRRDANAIAIVKLPDNVSIKIVEAIPQEEKGGED